MRQYLLKILVLGFFAMLSLPIFAEKNVDTTNVQDTTKYWKFHGLNSLSFSQTSFSNWAEGGDNSYSGTMFIDWNAVYEKGNHLISNYLKLGYGVMKPAEINIRKTDDVIDFGQSFGWKAVEDWYYSTQYSMKTQFSAGYKYPNDSTIISNFFAPATLTTSLGMKFSRDKEFTFFISPASGTLVFVLDQDLADKGVGGVVPAVYETVQINDTISKEVKIKSGNVWKPSFGILVEANLIKEVFKNVSLNTKLKIKNNYLDTDFKNRWNFDIDWETLINFTINKFMSASIRMHVIYDHDIPISITEMVDGVEITRTGPRTQFKDIIGIGLAYKLGK